MQLAPNFDPSRAVLDDYLDGSVYPPRLEVTHGQALCGAVDAGALAPSTRLLTFEIAGVRYVFPMELVLIHNVIQGEANGQPWMMTFCNACNAGMVFDPRLDGRLLRFQRRGSYDGLLLIWDDETGSYWQHITGECLYGSSAGRQLTMLATTRHMTAAEALATPPGDRLLLTRPLSAEQAEMSQVMEKLRSRPERFEAGITATIAAEDTRRPRFELGLGIWQTRGQSSFIPLMLVHQHDNALLTRFNGRTLLVYQTPDAVAPVAAYVETTQATWQGDQLRLDNGVIIQDDRLYDADGQPHALDCPRQLLMRWYGFALTFPGCALLAGG